MDAADARKTEAFEAVIGLEVHVQLRTQTKMFCRCASSFGGAPNTRICETCLGYPGALPVANSEAVEQAVRLACALDASVKASSSFARKSYFYPDQPKGFQITQDEHPLATGGRVPLEDGAAVPLQRLHLEEDAGKLLHGEDATRIDFDRAGVPLVEIVTEPSIRSPEEAEACLRSLHRVLLHTGTSDGQLEEGSLRCDANVSLRRRGQSALGVRCEVKNLNSFRHVSLALRHEIERQAGILHDGGSVRFETRTFDPRSGATRALRGKEGAPDYRYFPEPDLPPLVVSEEMVRRLAEGLPELPWARQARYVGELGLTEEEAATLVADPDVAGYFENVLAAAREEREQIAPRRVGHRVRNEALRTWPDVPAPERLAELLLLEETGVVSATAAKELYAALVGDEADRGTPLEELADRLGLLQVRDDDALLAWIDEVLAEHPRQVAEYVAGKEALLGFFVGGVMRRSGGAADPQRTQRLLVDRLSAARDTPSSGRDTP